MVKGRTATFFGASSADKDPRTRNKENERTKTDARRVIFVFMKLLFTWATKIPAEFYAGPPISE